MFAVSAIGTDAQEAAGVDINSNRKELKIGGKAWYRRAFLQALCPYCGSDCWRVHCTQQCSTPIIFPGEIDHRKALAMLAKQKQIRVVISNYDGETFPCYVLQKNVTSHSEAAAEATALAEELLKRGWSSDVCALDV